MWRTPSISTVRRTNCPVLKPFQFSFGRRVSVTLSAVWRRTSMTSARASCSDHEGRISSR